MNAEDGGQEIFDPDLRVGLEGDKFFFHLPICSCTGDNHSMIFFLSEMGRKTKTERVLEKKNFELGKTRVGN